jgi:hypothetical protein
MKNTMKLGSALLGALIAVAPLHAAPKTAKKPATSKSKAKPALLIVQGKIKALATVPRPGTVPYKDALMAIHLSGVKPSRGKMPGSVLVYVWGMRANKLTPAASYKSGQSVKLAVQPWDKVEGKYGRYQRRELDDEATFTLDTFWGEPVK